MDVKDVDKLGGFSMVKVLLSNVLPPSVYDPCANEVPGGDPDHHPMSDRMRPEGEKLP